MLRVYLVLVMNSLNGVEAFLDTFDGVITIYLNLRVYPSENVSFQKTSFTQNSTWKLTLSPLKIQKKCGSVYCIDFPISNVLGWVPRDQVTSHL